MNSMITSTIGVASAFIIVFLIRKDRLHVRYGVWWFCVAIAFIVFGLFPTIFDRIATALGIASGPLLALTLGLTTLFLKVLTVNITQSRLESRMIRLVQRIAILEADLKACQDRAGNEESIEQDRDP